MLKHIANKYISHTNSPENVTRVSLNRPRYLSELMLNINGDSSPTATIDETPLQVGFLLAEHFSMMAFTAAVSALSTSNQLFTDPLFSFTTYGISSDQVLSDQGIMIAAEGTLDSLPDSNIDILIVCGGVECSTSENKQLSQILKAREKKQTILGGICNGAISLAYAGLLDDMPCALHPDSHALMNQQFERVIVSELSCNR
jgi:transcriptional regulator GlxA family with amidase domain